ncbi:hypothetical protein [uncultured Thiodictyon sp.]|uniref:hypothetical protein n=1 Tax=uncultured Thiodictyon sp. TaxID=1846217 RepID=UPI0025CD127F|nr:hypothetical protein [uncultured Thiodictyon sp.]
MSDQTEVDLKLSVQKVNTVLNALGQLPYAQVATLIGEIKSQAELSLKSKIALQEPV